MAETKQKNTEKLEREYTIPLRRAWVNVVEYKRSRKAVLAIKIFIAKHMHVENRDIDKVKLDVYLNNNIWYRGRRGPPSKIKVNAVKENGIVTVKFAETPQYEKFLKIKHSKIHKQAEATKPAEVKTSEAKVVAKTAEQKLDEKEKDKSIEIEGMKQAEAQQKAAKHTTSQKEPRIQRKALSR
ncbi:MAG: 50S ribosomal protein L31e [archaeon]